MKNVILVISLLYLIPNLLFSQEQVVYPLFFEMMEADQPITHLSAPFIYRYLKSSSDRSRFIDLTEAEGKKGFVVEPSLDLSFPLIQGKTGGRPFWNTFEIGINYGFNTRVVKTSSSPILPPTNRIGISMDKVIFETVSGTSWFPWSFRRDLTPVLPVEAENIQILYFSFLLEHYSNGQNGETLLKDPNDERIDLNRNNYEDGDFSTNFARFNITYSNLHKNRTRLFTASLGMQFDMGSDDGFLAFFEEQEKRYGKVRLLSMLQYKFPIFSENHEIRLRLENQLIFCECEKYPYNDRYLNGTSLFLEYNPIKLRTLGFLLHFYRGRDYLNIRYDDPIFIAHAGITISQKKYRPLKKVISELY